MNKKILSAASASMALAIILGAMAAHALESLLSPGQIESFETAVRYHAWHSLAIIAVQVIPASLIKPKVQQRVSQFFFAGILFFSGSIYLLSTRDLLGLESLGSILGPITPIGGLLFITGWIMLSISFFKR